MKFLGIDCGLRKTGWAIIQKVNSKLIYIKSGIIRTKIQNENELIKSDALALQTIYDSLIEIITLHQPNHASIENTYVNNNPLSSLKLAQARAAAIIACCTQKIIPYEYQASTIKKVVTGKGNADKIQVNKMICLQLGKINTESNDESDAIAIAMCDALSK